MPNTIQKGSEIKIGSKLIKEDGTIVTVKKVGYAGRELVFGLSDDTMVFKDDLGKRIKILEEFNNL